MNAFSKILRIAALPLAVIATTHAHAAPGAESTQLKAGDDWQQLISDVQMLAGSELSAALTQAYTTHIDKALPLPPEVKTFLRGIIPDAFIERARYVVSNDSATLPGILNQGNRAYMAQDNAVSIDNLIIFSREPTFKSGTDARWWAHELGHHMQYQRLGGIDAFARKYVLDFQGMENEAESYGTQALKKYVELYR